MVEATAVPPGPPTNLERVFPMALDDGYFRAWLLANAFPAKRVTYRIVEATPDFVIFAATPGMGKVMLPLDLLKEWIQAYELRKIGREHSPREMSEVVRIGSAWASQLHTFETHLAAVVQRWSMASFDQG